MQSRAENDALLRAAESNSLHEGQGILFEQKGNAFAIAAKLISLRVPPIESW